MSLDALRQVLSLAIDDPAFAAQLANDPSLLTGYDLSPEERRALLAGDTARLRELGLEEHLLAGLVNVGGTRREGEGLNRRRSDSGEE
ncbi:MAG: hypothetical protein M3133_09495 [Actinomycetota bacterium]|nr:hypothetical protein [Actinomycetota bacterium]